MSSFEIYDEFTSSVYLKTIVKKIFFIEDNHCHSLERSPVLLEPRKCRDREDSLFRESRRGHARDVTLMRNRIRVLPSPSAMTQRDE